MERGIGEHCWRGDEEYYWGALGREALASAVDPASQPGMDPITYPIGFCSSLQFLDKELKLLLGFWSWLIKQKLMAKRK